VSATTGKSGDAGLRVGVVGATGGLGGEVLVALAESRLRVAQLRPFASEASLGTAIEFQGDEYPVSLEEEGVAGLDLLLLCAPPAASLGFVRLALHAQVPCIDLSGALGSRAEVPLEAIDLAKRAGSGAAAVASKPVVAAPDGASLALLRVLLPLGADVAPRLVVATLFDSVSIGGRRGIDALHQESIALFNQQELPEPEVFAAPVAFDCLPSVGELDAEGHSARELRLRDELTRLLGDAGIAACAVAATAVQVPAFVGFGASVFVSGTGAFDAKRAADQLRAAPGVELVEDPRGPTLRSVSSAEGVRVGRLRVAPGGLALWLVADPLRLAAANAIHLAEARFEGRPGALRARAQ
jgi:aspartate-semialdehyde dehydrogenase